MFDPTPHGRFATPSHASPPPPSPDASVAATELAPELRPAWLAGEDGPLARRGLPGVIDGLLRTPANLMYDLAHRPRSVGWLAVATLASLAAVGVMMGAFSGGYQLLVVPAKVCLGMVLVDLICLPSLYIFACLSGGEHTLRRTASALLAGTALTAVLLLGFAPISWLFSQATDSPGLMGGLHLVFLMISVYFGLRLIRRALAHQGGRKIPVLVLWSLVFVLVMLQMSTTLRPLVGPFRGLELADKEFFLAHWFS